MPSATRSDLRRIIAPRPTNRKRTTVGDVMAATVTDGWIVTQHGKVLARALLRAACDKPTPRHLLMSVSKSLIGMVAGALVSNGALDVDAGLTQLRARTGQLRIRRCDGAPPARHAFGHHVFRGLSGPDGRGAAARAGHRLGAAPVPDLPTTMYDFLLRRASRSRRTAGRSSTGPVRPTCSAGSARRPADCGCPS